MDKDLSSLMLHEYLGSRGLAYVEVLALFDEIKTLIEKGYSISAIFRMYSDKQKIAGYTFNTFRRAIIKAELKKKRAHRATQKEQPRPVQHNNPEQRLKPHEMPRPQRQLFQTATGVDHIGLSK